MSDGPSLTVILPIYNEIEILEPNLRHIDQFLATHFADYEILIVESASTDGTAEADRKSTRLNSSHSQQSRMPSSA